MRLCTQNVFPISRYFMRLEILMSPSTMQRQRESTTTDSIKNHIFLFFHSLVRPFVSIPFSINFMAIWNSIRLEFLGWRVRVCVFYSAMRACTTRYPFAMRVCCVYIVFRVADHLAISLSLDGACAMCVRFCVCVSAVRVRIHSEDDKKTTGLCT